MLVRVLDATEGDQPAYESKSLPLASWHYTERTSVTQTDTYLNSEQESVWSNENSLEWGSQYLYDHLLNAPRSYDRQYMEQSLQKK